MSTELLIPSQEKHEKPEESKIAKKNSCNKSSNQKRLTVEQKLEVLKKLDSKVSMTDIAQEYGISRPAVYKISKKRDEILQYSSKSLAKKHMSRKTIRLPFNEVMDEILISWLDQIRRQGTPISGPLICESALQVNEMIGGSNNFKASDGWLSSFKKRHGLRKRQIHGEKLSADTDSATKFKETFRNFIKEEGYLDENIYSGDETGLNWKLLPRTTLALGNEDSCPGHKIKKEKISVLLCANADGSCRLPPLVIGKSKHPRCFKNKILPVIYTSQKSSWMDRDIFLEWYKNNFIPYVKSQQKVPGKVLLLLDNCPAHPSAEVLNAVDPQFRVMYFPPNVTSLIQPMDQGVIEKTKRLYRKNLLRMVSSSQQDYYKDPENFLKDFDLFDSCNLLASAWNELTQENLAAAWSKLKPLGDNLNNSGLQENLSLDEAENSLNITTDEINDLMNVIKKIPGLILFYLFNKIIKYF